MASEDVEGIASSEGVVLDEDAPVVVEAGEKVEGRVEEAAGKVVEDESEGKSAHDVVVKGDEAVADADADGGHEEGNDKELKSIEGGVEESDAPAEELATPVFEPSVEQEEGVKDGVSDLVAVDEIKDDSSAAPEVSSEAEIGEDNALAAASAELPGVEDASEEAVSNKEEELATPVAESSAAESELVSADEVKDEYTAAPEASSEAEIGEDNSLIAAGTEPEAPAVEEASEAESNKEEELATPVVEPSVEQEELVKDAESDLIPENEVKDDSTPAPEVSTESRIGEDIEPEVSAVEKASEAESNKEEVTGIVEEVLGEIASEDRPSNEESSAIPLSSDESITPVVEESGDSKEADAPAQSDVAEEREQLESAKDLSPSEISLDTETTSTSEITEKDASAPGDEEAAAGDEIATEEGAGSENMSEVISAAEGEPESGEKHASVPSGEEATEGEIATEGLYNTSEVVSVPEAEAGSPVAEGTGQFENSGESTSSEIALDAETASPSESAEKDVSSLSGEEPTEGEAVTEEGTGLENASEVVSVPEAEVESAIAEEMGQFESAEDSTSSEIAPETETTSTPEITENDESAPGDEKSAAEGEIAAEEGAVPEISSEAISASEGEPESAQKDASVSSGEEATEGEIATEEGGESMGKFSEVISAPEAAVESAAVAEELGQLESAEDSTSSEITHETETTSTPQTTEKDAPAPGVEEAIEGDIATEEESGSENIKEVILAPETEDESAVVEEVGQIESAEESTASEIAHETETTSTPEITEKEALAPGTEEANEGEIATEEGSGLENISEVIVAPETEDESVVADEIGQIEGAKDTTPAEIAPDAEMSSTPETTEMEIGQIEGAKDTTPAEIAPDAEMSSTPETTEMDASAPVEEEAIEGEIATQDGAGSENLSEVVSNPPSEHVEKEEMAPEDPNILSSEQPESVEPEVALKAVETNEESPAIESAEVNDAVEEIAPDVLGKELGEIEVSSSRDGENEVFEQGDLSEAVEKPIGDTDEGGVESVPLQSESDETIITNQSIEDSTALQTESPGEAESHLTYEAQLEPQPEMSPAEAPKAIVEDIVSSNAEYVDKEQAGDKTEEVSTSAQPADRSFLAVSDLGNEETSSTPLESTIEESSKESTGHTDEEPRAVEPEVSAVDNSAEISSKAEHLLKTEMTDEEVVAAAKDFTVDTTAGEEEPVIADTDRSVEDAANAQLQTEITDEEAVSAAVDRSVEDTASALLQVEMTDEEVAIEASNRSGENLDLQTEMVDEDASTAATDGSTEDAANVGLETKITDNEAVALITEPSVGNAAGSETNTDVEEISQTAPVEEVYLAAKEKVDGAGSTAIDEANTSEEPRSFDEAGSSSVPSSEKALEFTSATEVDEQLAEDLSEPVMVEQQEKVEDAKAANGAEEVVVETLDQHDVLSGTASGVGEEVSEDTESLPASEELVASDKAALIPGEETDVLTSTQPESGKEVAFSAPEPYNLDEVASSLHDTAEKALEQTEASNSGETHDSVVDDVARIVLEESNKSIDSSREYITGVVQKVAEYAQGASQSDPNILPDTVARVFDGETTTSTPANQVTQPKVSPPFFDHTFLTSNMMVNVCTMCFGRVELGQF